MQTRRSTTVRSSFVTVTVHCLTSEPGPRLGRPTLPSCMQPHAFLSCQLQAQPSAAPQAAAAPREWVDRFGDQPRKGCDILVQALEREGVDMLFAYPGGASMEIHQALTRSETVQNILCRHEQVGAGGSGSGRHERRVVVARGNK